MQTRPSFISEIDFKLLKEKFPDEKKLKKVIHKIENDYPVQYAIGDVEFFDTKILVNRHVLIPRFETELLVSKLIDYIKKYDLNRSRILDVCTGSGCIAISLKKSLIHSKVHGLDKSTPALRTAKKNARLNGVDVSFKRCDVLKKIKIDEKVSILVSNPPYVKLDEYTSPNTKYEPSIALFPGEDDIIFYKKILDFAATCMYPKNIIAFEIGSTQAERICAYAKKIFKDAKIVVEKDYAGFERFIFIFNNCE